MTFDENCRVDVNTATGSYTVDDTGQNMEQEPITKTTVEYIIVREGDGEPTPSVLTADHKIRYTFPVEGMVRLVRRTTTTTEEVLYAKSEPVEVEAGRKQRKPRRKETEPRAVCRSTCCGAQHRRKSSIDGFCFDCRPSNSFNRREEVKQ